MQRRQSSVHRIQRNDNRQCCAARSLAPVRTGWVARVSAVGLIINERSDRSATVIDDLLYVARHFKTVRTEVLDGIFGLDKALIGMNNKDVDTLILAGGDGTMQAAFTETINNRRFDHTPHYVALPCGMTNVIANDCGLPGAPAKSLDNFLWRRQKGEVKPLRRSLLSVTAGGRDPVYGFFLGAGAFHSAVKYSRASIQSKGARRSIALLFSVMGYVYKVSVDPENTIEELDIEFVGDDADRLTPNMPQTILLATTLNKLGSGIFPFWGGGSGAMKTTTIDYPARRVLRAAPSVLRAKSRPWFEEYGYRSWRSDQLEMRFDGPFVFDGEFFHSEQRFPTVFATSENVDFLN